MRRRTQNILIALGVVLIIGELVGLGLILASRYKPAPQPLPTQIAVTTTQPETETTEQIIWNIIPDDGPIVNGPNVEKNRFTADDFSYDGAYLTCTAEPCLEGIDVSSYQPKVDWHQVKESGIDFVMIRVGGRGYGEAGSFFIDKLADTHYQGAKEAGLLVGAYFFSQALDEEEALEEANLALQLTEDWELDLPIAFDWELVTEDGRTGYPDMHRVSMCTRTFCDAIKAAGREPMVYLSLWFGYPYYEELMQYPIWLARYTDELDYPYRFDMWQYSASGKVPGIEGDVDMNIYFPPK